MIALLLAAAAAVAPGEKGEDPGPLLVLNVRLGDNIEAVQGQMRFDKIPFKRADSSNVVYFYLHCAVPFEDASPCALVTDRAMLVGVRGSVGPMNEKDARARFARARKFMEKERKAPGKKVAVRGKELERLEWKQTVEGKELVTELFLVNLPKGHEVRFAYMLASAAGQ